MDLLHKSRRVYRRATEHLGRKARHEREDEEPRLTRGYGPSSLFRRASHALHNKSLVSRYVAKMLRLWVSDRELEPACYINRLPTELLSLIFTISADDSSHYLDSDFAPFTLTHVCTLWRDIAVNVETLWRRFDLEPCLGNNSHNHLATICAERAKGLRLAISYVEISHLDFDETVTTWGDTAMSSGEFCACRLQLIGRLIGQIRSLALVIGESSAVQLALATREDKAIALEDLTVLFSGHVFNPEALAPFYSSPVLHRLRWSHIHEGTTRLTICIVYPIGVFWQQQPAVDPLGLLLDMLEEMVDECEVARYIKICMHWSDEISAIPRQTRLAMSIIGEEPLDNMVLAPPIVSLLHALSCAPPRHVLEAPGRPLLSSGSFLQSFRDAVSEELASLDLTQCRQLDELTLIKCIELPQMAKLQHLNLDRMQLGALSDQFILSLQADSSGNMLFPELQELSLSPCTTSADGIVARMLESRLAFSGSLEKVHISFGKTGQHEHDERFIEERFGHGV